MRKRISVCMLAAMMSVTSMYSFAAQGAENETGSETETSIEVESDAEIDMLVDPMNADKLLVKIRVIQPEEILDAYFGKENWDKNLIYETILVTYKEARPDEESMIEEWEKLLQTLNIDIMDEYIRQTDYLNGDRPTYTYYIQQDGIKFSPETYSIGKVGNSTDYFGVFVSVSV